MRTLGDSPWRCGRPARPRQETPPRGPGTVCAFAGVPRAPGAALWWLWRCGDRKFGGFMALALVGFANAPPGTMCFGGRVFVGGEGKC